MMTSNDFIDFLQQLKSLCFRLVRAEMALDELKKHVSKDTFETTMAKVEGEIVSQSPDFQSRSKSIEWEIIQHAKVLSLSKLISQVFS